MENGVKGKTLKNTLSVLHKNTQGLNENGIIVLYMLHS